MRTFNWMMARSIFRMLNVVQCIGYTCYSYVGTAYLELPKASVAASLAKQLDTISGRVHRSNAVKKPL